MARMLEVVVIVCNKQWELLVVWLLVAACCAGAAWHETKAKDKATAPNFSRYRIALNIYFRYTHCRTGKGNLRGWLREIGKEDGEECRWCGEGYEDGEHIVFNCEKLWRPEADRGQKWSTWEDLEVDCPGRETGGQGGEMEEWDLVEEFFNRIRELEEEDEDGSEDEDED